jgi:hypothetical protein
MQIPTQQRKSYKGQTGICYLCGEEALLTNDHVPPKCLAPETDNSVFYYAPACGSCNKSLSVHENRFRDFAVALAKDGVREAEDAFGKMSRSFKKIGKEERDDLLNRDFYRLFNNIIQVESHDPSGALRDPFWGIKPAQDLDYRSVLIKIARGLHYQHTQQIVPNDYGMHADFVKVQSQLSENLLRQVHISGAMGDFFAYLGSYASDDHKSGIWYMGFYQSVLGIAVFGDPDKLQSFRRSRYQVH